VFYFAADQMKAGIAAFRGKRRRMSAINGLGTMGRHRHFRTRTESKSRDTAAGYWNVLIVLACAVFILSSASLPAATPVAI
jgi:hypothetical protein